MTCLADRPAPALCRPGCRLLVVDDEEPVTAALCDYFSVLGYVVDRAGSESAARVLLRNLEYTAMVTDLCLSGSRRMEGLEIVEDFRRQHPQAACIVLTAYGDPAQEREARRRGADVLLQKPAPLAMLAAWLACLLDRRVIGTRKPA